MADSEASSTKEEKEKRAEEGRREGGGKEQRGEEGRRGGKDAEEEGGRRQVPQRRNSQRAEREEERRSRRALFQSVSTSNLNQQVISRKSKHDHDENFPQPSSSLPPPLPRFHLGDLDQSALPPKVMKGNDWRGGIKNPTKMITSDVHYHISSLPAFKL